MAVVKANDAGSDDLAEASGLNTNSEQVEADKNAAA